MGNKTERKKAIYISGPMTAVKNYWEAFEQAENDIEALGYIPLSPARLPHDLTRDQAMRICFAMIDTAEAVLFLDDWEASYGSHLEYDYCQYTSKPVIAMHASSYFGEPNPPDVRFAWLKHDLEEVLK